MPPVPPPGGLGPHDRTRAEENVPGNVCLGSSEKTELLGWTHTEVSYRELAHMILEAEKSHDLLSGICKLEPQESQWCNYDLSPKA